jgi:ubiquinone/menaquinone biosynthesis C-methylase UbiE
MSEPDSHGGHDYLPGRHDTLLPLYDIVQRLAGIPALHRRLVDRAAVGDTDDVLEVGCGTGNLTVLAKSQRPEVQLTGAGPGPTCLACVNARPPQAGSTCTSTRAYGQNLPYADDSFDHVLSAFMLHHLDADAKSRIFQEIKRVLRPEGSLHLVDFGGRGSRADGPIARLQRRSPLVRDNVGSAVPTPLREA